MKAVALRLEGPLQAWGAWGMGDDRDTLDAPTRSGVLGLAAACLGIERGRIGDIAELHRAARVHVRVDRPGTRVVDDQTIQGLNEVHLGNGKRRASRTRATIQSKRGYLADASFVALLIAGDEQCARIADAVRAPRFVPYLGRKNCPPSTPLAAIVPSPLLDVFGEDPLRLFAAVPFAERPRVDGIVDYWIDGDIGHPDRLRVLRHRDVLCGPLARQFSTRVVTHVRMSSPSTES